MASLDAITVRVNVAVTVEPLTSMLWRIRFLGWVARLLNIQLEVKTTFTERNAGGMQIGF